MLLGSSINFQICSPENSQCLTIKKLAKLDGDDTILALWMFSFLVQRSHAFLMLHLLLWCLVNAHPSNWQPGTLLLQLLVHLLNLRYSVSKDILSKF